MAIYNLLNQLGAARATRIAVEARVLLVSNNFLDDFRIGWSEQSPAKAAPGLPAAGKVPDFQATIMDNWTLNLILTATQGDKHTLTITAPRCTVPNGMQGRISGVIPRHYVSGYAAKPVAIEASPYTPEDRTIDTGLEFTVRPTMSQDGRNVVTQLAITRRILTGMDHAPAPNVPADAKLVIDKPVVAAATGTFTLTIPDGGTALINGGAVPVDFLGKPQVLAGEETPKGERVILIMLRPNIIIHREIEMDPFGVGNDRSTGTSTAPAATAPAARP
jgi:hypothetical protein